MTPEQAQNLRTARDTLPRVPITGPYYDPNIAGQFCSVGHMAKVAGVDVYSTADSVNNRIINWFYDYPVPQDVSPHHEFYGLDYAELNSIVSINECTIGRWRRHKVVQYINKLLTNAGYPVNTEQETLS